MTKEELTKLLAEEDNLHLSRKKDIYKKYAFSNNPHKIGDIVKDHIGSLLIERIDWYLGFYTDVCCVYYGTELDAKGNPLKKQTNREVYQSNIK